ncbi:MAG: anti-sigma factor antagonist [Actinomycetota bacterium]|nr:anti-sigma factor antagonist [Actinomycetota bacterium]
MTELTATVHTSAGGHLFELAGHLDFRNVSYLREVVEGVELGPGQQLIFDMSGLSFCDSTGLTVLVMARNRALAAHAGFALAAVSGRVARIFRVAGLDQVFSVYPSPEAAAEAWTRSAG